MKKNIFIILFFNILVHSVFAVEYFQFSDFVANDECIFWTRNYCKVDRKKLFVGEDGWYHFEDKLIIFQPDGYERFVHASLFNFTFPCGNVNMLNYRTVSSPWGDPELINVSEAVFSASSFLKEEINGKKICYSPENLSSYMKNVSEEYKQNHFFSEVIITKGVWDYSHHPWVEGVDGYGTGEKLTCRFSEKVYSFVILNGYVDPLHPDFYKKNSRVKKIKVTDSETKKSYVFELKDKVIEQRFVLDEPAKVLEFEILDVYKGSKFKDTCITGLYGETYPAFLFRSDGDYDVVKINVLDLIQNEIKEKFESYDYLSDSEVKNVSVKDNFVDPTEYFVREVDRDALYGLIVKHCKKNNYEEIEYAELYDDNNLKLYLKFRNRFCFESNNPVKSIEYRISSSIPLLNDTDVITDISENDYSIRFKGFYEDWCCYYHFITGITLKFNFSNGDTIIYTASESDLKKILKHYDTSAKIQYEH